ncbi:type IV toxin-antitoxin system AbiEi family antitoxin domain-containing protein [Bradyrhizobium tropiciagri]|uniref:type IV toxin-antitoxin system AbiEi family antitoxin domain-containing protein n=1 Tax=Bradyrhizobium tropiciagri TaxID=312253 RepID=UPI001BA49EA4|nr:type IV toxin-antitoxin system AbiEi family antitoxin domain-containing protein [Bradyrhizobium tropiciagri]MBR0900264.1 type IV toxin-antitoxin system AbiEi family antitoxin domain-containing protein [Bradyrhizobium tropiciagri]
MKLPSTQQDRAIKLLKEHGIARSSELTAAGVTAATVARMKQKGLIVQLGRGLYQLPDAPIDTHHSLVEATKRVPKGVIALISALSFHDLTDTIPSRVWLAIGSKDRQPLPTNPPMQFVRFSPERLQEGVETHIIEGCSVKIFSPAKTVVDLFRYRRSAGTRYRHSTGLNLALEGLREALRTRKVKPSEIADFARKAGVWKAMQPYMDAMTANG